MKQTTNVTVSLRAGSQTGHMKVESPMPNPEVQGPNVETHYQFLHKFVTPTSDSLEISCVEWTSECANKD